ncbi:MAG: sigma-70 family RNA polymerase sigma factor [Phycisphaerales bacterium]|nr:sigma-70 family RNA polymerase sigma factor [Phycisphaerales bacterium]
MNTPVKHDDCLDLEAVRAGDLDGFGRIHDRYSRLVLSICRRHGPGGPGGSLAEAEDATQEVFIRAYEKLDRVEDCTRLGSWIARIARFVSLERRRARGRRQKHEGAAMTAMPTHDHGHSAESDAMRRERFQDLELAMDALADEERLAIHIQYLEHDPVATAANMLDLSRSGYYKLLARARARLAELMRSHEGEVSQ